MRGVAASQVVEGLVTYLVKSLHVRANECMELAVRPIVVLRILQVAGAVIVIAVGSDHGLVIAEEKFWSLAHS